MTKKIDCNEVADDNFDENYCVANYYFVDWKNNRYYFELVNSRGIRISCLLI